MIDHIFSDAYLRQVCESPSPMCSHDNHIGLHESREIDNAIVLVYIGEGVDGAVAEPKLSREPVQLWNDLYFFPERCRRIDEHHVKFGAKKLLQRFDLVHKFLLVKRRDNGKHNILDPTRLSS